MPAGTGSVSPENRLKPTVPAYALISFNFICEALFCQENQGLPKLPALLCLIRLGIPQTTS